MRKIILGVALFAWMVGVVVQAAQPDADFKVGIKEVKVLTPSVRPGGTLVVDITFEALEGRPTVEYNGFLHVEREMNEDFKKICNTNLALTTFGIDWWKTGGDTYQGIYAITVPPTAPEGERVVHFGFFWEAPDFMAEDALYFTVDKNAPAASFTAPAPMDKRMRGERQAVLSSFADQPLAELKNLNYEFRINKNGEWRFTDLANDLDWISDPDSKRFGVAGFLVDGEKKVYPIDQLTLKQADENKIVLLWNAPEGVGEIEFVIARNGSDDRALDFSWKQLSGTGKLSDMVCPENAFGAVGEEDGIALIPNAMGVLMYADENIPTKLSFLPYNSYGGLYMTMGGMVRGNGGILFYWDEIDATLGVRRQWNPAALPGTTALDLTLVHPGEGSFTLVNAGTSDYAKVTANYRAAAREKGYLKTFVEKYGKGNNPIDGCLSYRMDCASHFVPNTRFNPTDKEIRHLGYTFEEVADTSEYLHNVLGVEKALVVVAGWGNCGYDFHPDVLPANEEAGGDEGLRKASERIRALGYLFGGHDNYQDIYPTAPSWDENDIARKEDGSLLKGGVWAHGQCYIASNDAQLKYAKRNIPEIKKRYGFNYHLIDTVFAVPLVRDFNPEKPASRLDDLKGKQELCRYVKEQIGLVGSEEGVEWAVPVADYFDSIFGQRVNRRSSDVVVPLFEMVYGDCISMFQGNRTTVTMADSVLDHILCAEMPQIMFPKFCGAELGLTVDSVSMVNDTVLEVKITPTAEGNPPEESQMMVHLGEVGMNLIQESAVAGADLVLKKDDWNRQHTLNIGLPEKGGEAFEILVMTINRNRLMMKGMPEINYQRYLAGCVALNDGKAVYSAPEIPEAACFALYDANPEFSGNNAGMTINMANILGDIMARTQDYPMTGHKFLTEDRKVEQSQFGPITITVNYGETPYDTGRFVLPKWGFAAEGPDFTAFRADAADGKVFAKTTMLSRTPERTFFASGDASAK